MFLIIIGILLLIISFSIRPMAQMQRPAFIGKLVGIAFIILGFATTAFVQIEAGYVGVKKLFGNIQPTILTSGLHVVNPLYDIERLDVRTLNYTMSGINDEGH